VRILIRKRLHNSPDTGISQNIRIYDLGSTQKAKNGSFSAVAFDLACFVVASLALKQIRKPLNLKQINTRVVLNSFYYLCVGVSFSISLFRPQIPSTTMSAAAFLRAASSSLEKVTGENKRS